MPAAHSSHGAVAAGSHGSIHRALQCTLHVPDLEKNLYPCSTGKSYFSHNTVSWNKFLSLYSQSVCNSLKLEPCSALVLADLQNDPHYHSTQRICWRNTNLPLFCTVKLLQAVRALCQGQMCREDAAVLFFWRAAGSATRSKSLSLPLLPLSYLMFPPFQKDPLKKTQQNDTVLDQ